MSKGRILVVDDEPNARTALAEILKEESYTVETAADGFKGLARYEEATPDLVLTDLKMPGMDGVELLRKLRQHDPELPVVIMTAFGAVETAVSAMREGAADYLTKPLNTDELTLVIERALERCAPAPRNRGPARASSPSAIASTTSSAPPLRCRRCSRRSRRSRRAGRPCS